MDSNTISDAMTMAGGAESALLANRYRIVKQLGQGGMGSVWLAEDTQLDNKPFAIKMLPSILVSNKRAYRQLKSEALVAIKLVHPNIVQIRAFEENNSNPFLVMDYIEGETLDDCLAERGKLTEDETIRILKPIAAALDYAHGEGVVHRDVKPANIMIRKDGHPYILDFGIAREIQETMTRVTGKLSSGTLLYMSPEQLRGQPPKPSQDVYSFAAMAYECLKGEPPFSRGQIEYQILNQLPERLSDDIRMSASIMRGLSKTPVARPDSCVKVLLTTSPTRQMPSARPQVAVPPRPAEQMTGKIVVRPKSNIVGIVLPLFCLVAALLVLGGVLWHREAQLEENARRLAEEQQREEARRRQAEEERKAQEEAARKKAEAERLAKLQQEEAERKAEESRLAAEAERKAKDAATEVRIKAMTEHGKVVRISDADGFKSRKDSLEDVFIRAEAFYDENAKRWDDAVPLYKSYVEQSKALIALDEDRSQAVAKRDEVQTSFKEAEQAGAKIYAKDSWNAAVKTWNAATAEFRRMEFVSAVETFAKALREFDGCAEEARISAEKQATEKRLAEAREAEERRRAELARQEDARRRQEERRKAMQSLPGRWECATTFIQDFGKGDVSCSLKYELVFRDDGRWTVKRISDNSETTYNGQWSLAGNVLTLRYDEDAVTVSYIQSKKYVHNFTVPYYEKPQKFIVYWRNDGAFELRRDINDLMNNHPDTIAHYDANGTYHQRAKWRRLFFSGETVLSETAKIFRRVSY